MTGHRTAFPTPSSPRRSRRRRAALAAAALGAATIPLSPFTPASATHEPPHDRGIARACPSGLVPEAGFQDTAGNQHAAAIDCVAWWDVAKGRSASEYAPAAVTQRDQMASFIARLIEAAGKDVPDNAPPAFIDVTPLNPHFKAVNGLAALGVVSGYGDRTYRPELAVQRDQMASFLSRASGRTDAGALTSEHQRFEDVGPENVHFPAVNGLAEVGVVQGRDAAARRYDPADPVRRDAMASFLSRTLDLFVARGVAERPPLAAAASLAAAGSVAGTVTLTERDDGVEVVARLTGLPAGGFHGFHVHAVGACSPDFTAAGGHHNPEGAAHGQHAGDLPVLLVDATGQARTRFVTDGVSIEGLLAGNGSALIVHADADNYANIPERYSANGPDEVTLATGDAGARLGCGVLNPARAAQAADRPAADLVATLRDPAGDLVGTVELGEVEGGVAVSVLATGLPPGFHGFHLHAVGMCAPDFTAAGGHHNPDGGTHHDHDGDLPVLLVRADGTAEATYVTDRVTIAELRDGDGTAVIVHALADNYANIPARYAPDGPDQTTLGTGDAGARIACGALGEAAAS